MGSHGGCELGHFDRGLLTGLMPLQVLQVLNTSRGTSPNSTNVDEFNSVAATNIDEVNDIAWGRAAELNGVN